VLAGVALQEGDVAHVVAGGAEAVVAQIVVHRGRALEAAAARQALLVIGDLRERRGSGAAAHVMKVKSTGLTQSSQVGPAV
jgi:hypothetical protein